MAETIWEYSNKQVKAENSFFAQLKDVNILVRSNQDKLSEHRIIKEEKNIPKDAVMVQLNPVFDLVPLAHHQTQISTSPIHKKYIFNNETVLRSYGKGNGHLLPYLLYQMALKSDHAHTTIAYLNDESLSIIFYSNGKCMLANSFDIKDTKELIYFFTSIANQHGLSINAIHFKLYSSIEASVIKGISNDYIPHLEIVKPELPYEADQMPPYSAESFLLLQLGACELPEEL